MNTYCEDDAVVDPSVFCAPRKSYFAVQNFANIPQELKDLKQWVIYKKEDNGHGGFTKPPVSPHTGLKCSKMDPSQWGSFEEAVSRYVEFDETYDGIGFVLTENDPYTFIDLDDAHKTDAEGNIILAEPDRAIEIQNRIFEAFISYAELSPSGKGCHIIVKGKTPAGKRNRDNVELYSSGAYMTMTGNVIGSRNIPIADYTEKVNDLYSEMCGSNLSPVGTLDISQLDKPQIKTDEEIWSIATNAANKDKFLALWNGDLASCRGDHSRADLAMFNMLVFYTQNIEQIKRMFRYSGLYRPTDKHKSSEYYFNMTIKKAFDNQLPTINFDALRKEFEAKPVPIIKTSIGNPYIFPPGILGDVAQFIFDQAAHPSKEIALAGALSFMSGLCGRTYNISGLGLNNYYLLLAKTGRGKEAMSSGISKLFTAVAEINKNILDFKGPSRIASPQGLHKHLRKHPCFCTIFGEFDTLVRRITSDHANSGDRDLHAAFLDLFGKSAKGNILSGIIYSDSEKNVEDIVSPCFSFLGECTPENYYKVANERLLTSGFLPRITTIEFNGKRAPHNPLGSKVIPTGELVRALADLVATGSSLCSRNEVIEIGVHSNAEKALFNYGDKCTNIVNTKDGVECSIWTRSFVKVLKLAGLAAVGINSISPVITIDCLQWAINIINHDNLNLISKFSNNEVGENNLESDQNKSALLILKNYLSSKSSEYSGSYNITDTMISSRMVSHRYLWLRLSGIVCFKNDKIGPTNAYKKTISNLIESGILTESAGGPFGIKGRAFCVTGDVSVENNFV